MAAICHKGRVMIAFLADLQQGKRAIFIVHIFAETSRK